MNKQSVEQALISQARQGDLEAFNQLVLLYQDRAYWYASSLTGDYDEAQDVTQESFLKAFQNIGAFRDGSFHAWLLRIISNTFYDLSRRKRKYSTTPLFPEDADREDLESPPWLRDPSGSVETIFQKKEEARQLFQMLEELPANHRTILTLIDLHELDYGEAARILHIPIGTVKSRLARARLEMKNLLQRQVSFPPARVDYLPAACR